MLSNQQTIITTTTTQLLPPNSQNSNNMYPMHSRPSSLSILPPPQQQSQPQHFFPMSNNTPTFTTSAIPLLATPSTPIALTPNTVKTIEQSILQTLGEDTEESYMMESQQYSGNFVPPLPSSTSTITLINTWQGGQVSSDGVGSGVGGGSLMEEDQEDKHNIDKPVLEELNGKPAALAAAAQQGTKGRRKPTRKASASNNNNNGKVKQEPKQRKAPATRGKKGGAGGARTEEDERRKIRRERNKLAAARCRKRRVDHTNKLIEETEGLEAKKRALQNQITDLQSVREELEFLLENHPCAKNSSGKIRTDVLADLQNLPRSTSSGSSSSPFIGVKPKRPSTLNVAVVTTSSSQNSGNSSERGMMVNVTTPAPPITISTPSNGIAGLGFEPLCSDWGVGTPDLIGEKSGGVVPVSSSNNNNSSNSSSLVTPLNPNKKFHDM